MDTNNSVMRAKGGGKAGLNEGGQKGAGGIGDICNSVNNKIFLKLFKNLKTLH